MKLNWRQTILLFGLTALFNLAVCAQREKPLLGVGLRAEIRSAVEEIEQKTKKKLYAEFVEFPDEYTLGVSFISESGTPIVRASENLREDKPRLEAVIAHEILHLKLRAAGFPVFLFSPTVKTKRGLAQDVEQSNVNDLASLIEHRIFKAEMDRLGFNRIVDLAGDTERSAARRAGDEDGQTEAINFARALLEYQNPKDVESLRKVYLKNNWRSSLKIGETLARLISRAKIETPADSAEVFRLCLAALYPSPRPFRLVPDKSVTAYRQFLIAL